MCKIKNLALRWHSNGSELLTIRNSWPPGAAFFTASMAMNPLAPGRVSIKTRSPQALASFSDSTWRKTAGPELAANDTWILTVLAGKDCASAAPATPKACHRNEQNSHDQPT